MDWLRHYLNPQHIYCRLCDFGLKPKTARKLVYYYEKVYKLFL